MILAECIATYSPVPFNRLDDETESGRDIVDVFVHHTLDYGRFPSIIQASLHHQLGRTVVASGLHVTTYSSNIRISLSFNRALRSIESILLWRDRFTTDLQAIRAVLRGPLDAERLSYT